MTVKLRDHYDKVVKPALREAFGYKSPMQVPRVSKIVVNMGVGEAVADAKKINAAASDLELITGQKPIIIKARKSVATFKLREGMKVGCKVTLRRERMYEFLDRLVSIALPRVRDFRGLSDKSFDGRGNFTLGISEQIIFPEIDYNQIDRIRGLQVTITTTAKDDAVATRLLELYGMPFIREV